MDLRRAGEALGYMASAETGLEYVRLRYGDNFSDHLSDQG
jgi:hypothetical protein